MSPATLTWGRPPSAVQKRIIEEKATRFVAGLASAIFIVLLVTQTAIARPNLEKELRRELTNKTFPLKSKCAKSAFNFNAHGELMEGCPANSWTVYSLFRIENVRLTTDALILTSARQIDLVIATHPWVKPQLPESNDMVLAFQLSASLPDIAAARTAIAPAFDSEEERAAELMPYNRLFPTPVGDNQVPNAPTGPRSKEEEVKPVGLLGPDRPIYRCGGPCGNLALASPVAVSAPDPEYTAKARRSRVRGHSALQVVVNEQGQPEVLKVSRRLGAGLEESAIDTVAAWKFDPGRKDGRPVVFLIAVELDFDLYP